MAVIVSDSRNAAYDGNLSTANAWYRAEYYQLHTTYTSSWFDTSTERFVDTTFANAGNCMGIAVGIGPETIYRGYQYYKNLQASLWEILGTTTMTIASPCVVTKAGHGLSGGEEIRFTTTGALPTGITANTHYFVNYIDANTFNISATSGGANINTSGSQSGTHTLHVVRRTVTQTPTDIVNTIDSISGTYLDAIKWSSGYAVDTTASKWQISLLSVAGTGTGDWLWSCATNSVQNVALVVWCDNQVTASSTNDALIIVDKIIPDASFQTKSYAVPTGGTTNYGICGWVCSRNDQHGIDNCETLYMNTSPGSPITLTIDGAFLISSHATVRFGKSTSRITGLNLVYMRVPSFGSAGLSGFFDARAGSLYYGNGAGLCLYGAIPTTVYGVLATDLAVSSTSVQLVDATGFQIGDYIVVGKGAAAGWNNGWTSSVTQVTNIVGNTLTISPANASTIRSAGAYVYRLTAEYGITLKSDTTSLICVPRMQCPGNFVFSGVLMMNIRYEAYFGSGSEYPDSRFNSQILIEDILCYCHNRVSYAGFRYLMPTSYGCKVNRSYFLTSIQSPLGFSSYSLFQTIRSSDVVKVQTGNFEVTNCHFQSLASDPIEFPSGLAYTVIKVNDCAFTNVNSLPVGGARGSEYKRNTVFGCTNGLFLYSLYNVTGIEGNSVQLCGSGVSLTITAPVIINSKDTGSAYGDVVANVENFIINPNAYVLMEFADFTGSLTPSATQLSYANSLTDGTILAFTNTTSLIDNTIQTFGRTQRCGTGLTDTTQYGSDTYSFRMENTDGALGNRFDWEMVERPIGNQQNEDLQVIGWVKIAKEAYWAGTHEMPRIYVDYDNGTEVYGEAAQYAGDTVGAVDGWQKISIPFTPTTTYGRIGITLTTKTDASTATNRYVYWGHFSVLDAAGKTVNTGLFNEWAGGLPVTPVFATVPPPADVAEAVWLADPSTFSAGTVGALVNSIKAKINGILGLVTTLLR